MILNQWGDLFLLSLALSLDIFLICFGLILDSPQSSNFSFTLKLAFIFSLSQTLMFLGGAMGGEKLIYLFWGDYYRLVVVGIFLVLGLSLWRSSFKEKSTIPQKMELKLYYLMFLALVTNIDALAAGVSYATIPYSIYDSLLLFGVCFVMVYLSYIFAKKMQTLPQKWLKRIAGSIFLFLAYKGYL